MSKRQKVKVVYRKLGREAAWGQAFIGEDRVEVDPRLGALRQLEVIIHEVCHICHPEMTEKEVDRTGKTIAKVLWSENYRRVLLEPNAKPPRIS
jgi:predicted SprT family Zn-dependent metalloprotease